jgi:hypothetical protein
MSRAGGQRLIFLWAKPHTTFYRFRCCSSFLRRVAPATSPPAPVAPRHVRAAAWEVAANLARPSWRAAPAAVNAKPAKRDIAVRKDNAKREPLAPPAVAANAWAQAMVVAAPVKLTIASAAVVAKGNVSLAAATALAGARATPVWIARRQIPPVKMAHVPAARLNVRANAWGLPTDAAARVPQMVVRDAAKEIPA